MALQFRRGTAANRTADSFTPVVGEPIFETDTNKLYIGDGSTVGGVDIYNGLNLANVNDVTLITETIENPDTYSIAANVVTLVFDAGHSFAANQSITIANSSVAALNGTYTVTSVTATDVVIPTTGQADIGSTALTADVNANIVNGRILAWDSADSAWKDTDPNAGLEIVGDTSPQLGGNLDVQANEVNTSTVNGNIKLAANGTGVVEVRGNTNAGAIKFNCEVNSHGVTLQGPAHSAAADYSLTLPTALPASTGLALISDTSGVLSWGATGGGGAATRSTANATTSSIADGSSANITITGAKSYNLMSIETSAAAWVTIYTSSAARTADASRTQNTDPLPGSGVIAEVITGSATTQKITPGLIGFNDESPVTDNIYAKVENQSGSTAAITVTLSFLILES